MILIRRVKFIGSYYTVIGIAVSDRKLCRRTLDAVVADFETPFAHRPVQEAGGRGRERGVVRGARVRDGDRALASGPVAVVRIQSGPRGQSCHTGRKLEKAQNVRACGSVSSGSAP